MLVGGDKPPTGSGKLSVIAFRREETFLLIPSSKSGQEHSSSVHEMSGSHTES
jgi:hypothetical protein